MKEKHPLLLISNIPRKESQGPDYFTVRDERLFKLMIAMFQAKSRAVFRPHSFDWILLVSVGDWELSPTKSRREKLEALLCVMSPLDMAKTSWELVNTILHLK